METTQKFGGPWTEEKLNLFTKYLDAYLTALQNKSFTKIYIDAFAGSGEIETSDGDQHLVGSAKRALLAAKRFDHYYFIEKDNTKAGSLQEMVNAEFPHLKNIVTIISGDANKVLERIINELDWHDCRGLLFLDPYATEVNWTTLETVATTKAIDVWYLFPLAALIRMLPNNGDYKKCEDCLDRLLGDEEWRSVFYIEDPQMTIFSNDEANRTPRLKKIVDTEKLKAYIIWRLKSVFPSVSEYPRVFKNSNNAPMFLFCFAVSNDKKKAQGLALRIADHILKHN